MNEELINHLLINETDVDGALKRLAGDDQLYVRLLRAFVEDKTMSVMEAAIEAKEWDDVFTAAHALKGLAGNMGFVPLFHSIGELVLHIRSGRIAEVDEKQKVVKLYYDDLIAAINQYC